MNRSNERYRNCFPDVSDAAVDAGIPDAGPYVPLFAFATDSGVGMSNECACSSVLTGTKGEALTFTRNSIGWCETADAGYISCAVDKPRVEYGDFASNRLGVLIERASTNSTLRNRDFSDLAWTPVNMTCVKDAAGIDGVAASASTCTAGAVNAIIGQVSACPASGAAASIFIKRITGTGTVSVSCDAVTYYTVVPTAAWKRISNERCNPSNRCFVQDGLASGCNSGGVYVKLATSGDAVALDFAQCEALGFTTSPIETAGTAATRIKDLAKFTIAMGSNTVQSSAATTSSKIVNNASTGVFVGNGPFTRYIWPQSPVNFGHKCFNNTINQAAPGSWTRAVDSKKGCESNATFVMACLSGTCAGGASSSTAVPTGSTDVYLGTFGNATDGLDGVIKQVCVDAADGGCNP